MATTRFSVPNWAQALIAVAANLDPDGVVVRSEDDTNICFLQHMPRKEFIVHKPTGKIVEG